MPVRAPRICGCGHVVASGSQCSCERRRAAERKARADAARPTARERGYDSKWDRERVAYLAAHPDCLRCGGAATVVDHIIPHRGDSKLFWQRSNWQPLCKSCHSRAKQAEEKRPNAAAQARAHPFLKLPRMPVMIVCGAPGSGKSTYVEQHKGPEDLVIDLDVIRSRLAGTSLYGAGLEWMARALDERNRILASLATDRDHERAWFIVSAPERAERDLWCRKLGTMHAVVMSTPLDECLRRIRADVRRIGHVEQMEAAAREWFAKAEQEKRA